MELVFSNYVNIIRISEENAVFAMLFSKMDCKSNSVIAGKVESFLNCCLCLMVNHLLQVI